MAVGPWWAQRTVQLLEPRRLDTLSLGALWRLNEDVHFVCDNVEPKLVAIDVARAPTLAAVWATFQQRVIAVRSALTRAKHVAAWRIKSGQVGKATFRAEWEALGFATNERDAGTPADDYLDGLLDSPRPETHAELPEFGSPNMGSRARKTADFLAVTQPCVDDTVIDLGSGSGKLAVTVAASTDARVVGVEYVERYVTAARASATPLALENLRFEHADVRDVDLTHGDVFYLYFPFRGALAQSVAQRLGTLARAKPLCIYASGPVGSFGEYFLREVDDGALTLAGKRGEFGEALFLHSRDYVGRAAQLP